MKKYITKQKITEKQKETYLYMINFFLRFHTPPSMNDLSLFFGFSAKCMWDRVVALEKHGLIQRENGKIIFKNIKIKIEHG